MNARRAVLALGLVGLGIAGLMLTRRAEASALIDLDPAGGYGPVVWGEGGQLASPEPAVLETPWGGVAEWFSPTGGEATEAPPVTFGGFLERVEAVSEDQAQRNIEAFKAVVRTGEGTADADGYRRMFGGELIASFADHPRKKITKTLGGKSITSTAAGAYQALSRTWDDFTRAVGPRDFSPASQDEFFIWALRRRGALEDVRAGRFDVAVRKCAKEWASLPGSPYGQPTISAERAAQLYASAGGTFA